MDGWMDGLAWLGLDLSKNTTPPRAPCGANKVFSRFFGENLGCPYNGDTVWLVYQCNTTGLST